MQGSWLAGELLATMQDLAGHPQFGFVELHGVSVQLLEGYRVIVAVLCVGTIAAALASSSSASSSPF